MTVETVVLTASAGSFAGLGAALQDVPVLVKERPLVSFSPPPDWSRLDAALRQKDRYDAVALTSPRSARAVADRSRACGVSWEQGNSPTVWAVGAGTVAALGDAIGSVRTPDQEGNSESSAAFTLASAMLAAHAAGPVLFPCGDRRRDELPSVLRAGGIKVDEVVCYRTVLADAQEARAALNEATVLVAASPSVVELLVSTGPSKLPLLVTIGPTTAAAARMAGWPPAAVAREPSTEALAAALTGLLAPR